MVSRLTLASPGRGEVKRMEMAGVQLGVSGFEGTPRLPDVLSAWHEWGDTSALRKWFGEILQDDLQVIQFAKAFITQGVVEASDGSLKQASIIGLHAFNDYANQGEVARRFRDVRANSELPTDVRDRISSFLISFDEEQEGMSDQGVSNHEAGGGQDGDQSALPRTAE
jgi:hypothetical protein